MEINQAWADEFFGALTGDLILKRRESTLIEFKEIFDWASKGFCSTISKASASFANRDGGVIIFGVADKPHVLCGVENFDSVDDAQIADYFNEHFSPSIDFKRASFLVAGKTVGVLQILESKHKPIVCIKDSPKTNDMDIYCRYSARSSKMKSGDLLILMQEVRQQEQDKWMKLIRNIAQIGLDNVSLLNSTSGELKTNHNTFLLDVDLLEKIKVLDQYSESVNGAPAVRIVGDLVDAVRVIDRQKNIFEEDIFRAFLTEQLLADGMEYIATILRMNSEIYPIYFFLNRMGIPPEKRIDAVNSIETRFKNKLNRFASRLANDSRLEQKGGKYSILGGGLAEDRNNYLESFIQCQQVQCVDEKQCQRALESIFKLKRNEFDIRSVKGSLLLMFDQHYPFEADNVNFIFRWALSYLDNISEK